VGETDEGLKNGKVNLLGDEGGVFLIKKKGFGGGGWPCRGGVVYISMGGCNSWSKRGKNLKKGTKGPSLIPFQKVLSCLGGSLGGFTVRKKGSGEIKSARQKKGLVWDI